MLFRLKILLIFIFGINLLYAQNNNSNIWYFGDYAGIDFNVSPPEALTDGQLSTWEGCASICDRSGKLLFYTDGSNVYDSTHNVMPNGSGLMGNYSSSQSAIIVPKPDSLNNNMLYYLFTTDSWENELENGLRYNVIDMSLNNGLGDITSKKNVLVVPKVGEKLAAIHHANGLDVWIVVHQWGNNNYLAYKLTSQGLEMTPVVSSIGIDYTGEYNREAGQLHFSENGTFAASSSNYIHRLEIYHFDTETGVFSDLISFQGYDDFRRVWGVEFSRNEKFLYFSRRPPDILCQLDLQNWDSLSIISSFKAIASTNGSPNDYDAGTLQMGPDDKIYLTRYDKSYLSVVENPEVAGEVCNFVEKGIDLKGRLSKWGLPNLIRSYFGADFTWQPDCFGDTTLFSLNYTGSIDSVRWDFGDEVTGDNNFYTGLSPRHFFSMPGTFVVKAIVYSENFEYTIEKQVVIMPMPFVDLGKDTSICTNLSLPLNAGGGYDSYLWQDGTTDSVFQVDTSGIYWVTVENECGTASDTIVVGFKESFEIDLGADTSFCYGNSILISPGGNYVDYLWQDGSNDTMFVAEESGTYWVQITDSTGCSATDSLTVETYPAFEFNLGNDTTICDGDYIFLNGPGGYESYLWQDGSDFTALIADTAGYYWLEVTDTNRCAVRDSLLLTTNMVPDTILGHDSLFCNGSSITLQTNPEYEKYFWQDGSEEHTLVVGEPGKYWVMVFDTLGCSGSDTINLDYYSPLELRLQATGYLCEDDSVLLEAISNYDSFLWQDSSTTQTYIAKDSGTYWVMVSSPCETKSDTLVIDACTSIWVPNVFTPNNDGYNDYFYAIGKNIPKFKMEIFNRWGQTLKVLNSIDEKWDGTYKGRKEPQGTYFWVADYEQVKRDGLAEHVKLQGSVTLVR